MSNPSLPKFYGQGNPVMETMFAEFVMWSFEQKDTREAFEAATGMKLPTGKESPLARMIDKATGYRGKVLQSFIEWLIKEQWGEYEPNKPGGDNPPPGELGTGHSATAASAAAGPGIGGKLAAKLFLRTASIPARRCQTFMNGKSRNDALLRAGRDNDISRRQLRRDGPYAARVG